MRLDDNEDAMKGTIGFENKTEKAVPWKLSVITYEAFAIIPTNSLGPRSRRFRIFLLNTGIKDGVA